MHANPAKFVLLTGGQWDGTTGGVADCGAIIGFTSVANVVVGDVGLATVCIIATAASRSEKGEA
jgi:hypothetical protein